MPVVGGYEGMMESQKHDAGMLLNMLSGAEKLGNIEMQPDRARLLAAQAGHAEAELAQEQAFAQAMSQAGGLGGPQMGPQAGEQVSRAAPLYRAAQIAFSAGAVKKGAEYLKGASTVDHQDNLDRMEQQRLNFYRNKSQMEGLERLSGYYGDIKSQEDLDAANAAFEQAYPQAKIPPTLRRYDPRAIAGFLASLQTQQQRVQKREHDEDQVLREAEERGRRERAAATEAIRKREEELRRDAATARAKAGEGKAAAAGAKATEVKDSDVDQARVVIQDTLFAGKVPPEFRDTVRNGAFAIAARAKKLRTTIPGLDAHAAYVQALQESVKGGEWAEVDMPVKDSWFGSKVKGRRFNAKPAGEEKPATKTEAAPLPANRSEWKVGQTYTKNGKTGVWNGTAFEVQ